VKEVDLPPDAPSLLASLRSIGYSLGSALADLIDNSIAAKARQVQIQFRVHGDPYVCLLDDGEGMSRDTLKGAMRHGSTSPGSERRSDDLGRYGLGLKTASLSQCRRLTVISVRDGKISGFQWDLDHVIQRGTWALLELDPSELRSLPHAEELDGAGVGTLVLWQGLDRIAETEASIEAGLTGQMAIAGEHLQLVFHRYLAGESGLSKLRLQINGQELAGLDPFLEEHRLTQKLPAENFSVHRSRVSVRAFVLPSLAKLSKQEIQRAGGAEGLRNQQGFYVYRNKRLLIWGTWFRLARKDELSKLARVRVDVPNSLDHLWTLDIKKSTATPPEAVRTHLRRTLERVRDASGRTLTFQGRKRATALAQPFWSEIDWNGGHRFSVNREHPAIQAMLADLDGATRGKLTTVLTAIEQSLPIQAIYARVAAETVVSEADDGFKQSEEFRGLLDLILTGWNPQDSARVTFLDTIHLIEPFNRNPELAKQLAAEIASTKASG
jgi:hypothetical protein